MDEMVADSISKISDTFPKDKKTMIDFLSAPVLAGGCNF